VSTAQLTSNQPFSNLTITVCLDVDDSAPAGDGTSTNPDIYSFALIKTKNALFDFSGEKLSIFF